MNAPYHLLRVEAEIAESRPTPRDIDMALWRQDIRARASRRRFQWATALVSQLGRIVLATLARRPRTSSAVDAAVESR